MERLEFKFFADKKIILNQRITAVVKLNGSGKAEKLLKAKV
jgi:chromosome segregation ATPase